MKELKYFYKTANGSTLADYVPHKEEGLIEITRAEWEQIVNSHKPTLKQPTAEELAKQEKLKDIARNKKFLADTDWVVIKIAEETDPEVQAALRTKYEDTIAFRKYARNRINQLEQSLKGE